MLELVLTSKRATAALVADFERADEVDDAETCVFELVRPSTG